MAHEGRGDLMAFDDYLDLRTSVIEMVRRPDIADVMDRLTLLAETWLNRNLRTKDQITETTLSFSSGVATLPTDYLETIGLYTSEGEEIEPRTLQDLQNDTASFPDGSYTFQYYAKLPTLTTSMTTTNWLLSSAPDLYLYAVGYEAAKHVQDENLARVARALREESLMDVMGQDFSARYSRMKVRLQGVTP
jgi:hypothetical protein